MQSRELIFPLISRRRIAGLAFGEMRSVRRGRGSDVASSRPYRPGDDIRSIDWKTSARLTGVNGRDDFIVREHYLEEALRVLLIPDKRPAMGCISDVPPMFRKPDALVAAGRMIASSASRGRCLVGYLDYADFGHPDASHRDERPFFRMPSAQTILWRVKERNLPHPHFFAPEDTIARSMRDLFSFPETLPQGSMIFLLSDFLVPIDEGLFSRAAVRWDMTAVVLQDPVWEQSFPDVSGTTVSVRDPRSGVETFVRFTAREVQEKRRANQKRFTELRARFRKMGVDAVYLQSEQEKEIFAAFRGWADKRRFERRGAR